MPDTPIFVSVGSTATAAQEAFVRAVEERLRAEGLVPHTVGRNSFSSESPFRAVTELLDRCAGVVVIALERLHIDHGAEKRGGAQEAALADVKLATPWNQIEAALAYSRGYPLLVLVEDGVRTDGLLETGFDWYVQSVRLDPAALATPVFNGVLSSWKAKLKPPMPRAALAPASVAANPGERSVAQLLGELKPAQLWSVLIAAATLVGGAFALGAKLGG